MTMKSDAKFEEKLAPGSKKDEEFIQFSPNYTKVQNLRLDGLFLFKLYEV